MHPDDLKAIRTALGFSQAQMAKALGITGTFIVLMERGAKPIERRIALAARYLAEHPEGAS